jgi:uncharacterized protein
MRKLLITAALLLALATSAIAQPIDCNHAKAPDEVTVCMTPDLRTADTDLAQSYTEAREPAVAMSIALKSNTRSVGELGDLERRLQRSTKNVGKMVRSAMKHEKVT